MNSITVPVEGGNVKQGVNWTKTADGKVVAAGQQPAGTMPEGAQPALTTDTSVTPAQPAKELSLIEQFHPSLDPAKVEMTWDEKTGRVKIAPRQPEETPT